MIAIYFIAFVIFVSIIWIVYLYNRSKDANKEIGQILFAGIAIILVIIVLFYLLNTPFSSLFDKGNEAMLNKIKTELAHITLLITVISNGINVYGVYGKKITTIYSLLVVVFLVWWLGMIFGMNVSSLFSFIMVDINGFMIAIFGLYCYAKNRYFN
ncbi:hypothetical protein ABE137_07360 [Brevibacillus laterosporus]|uniref:hypothetical protein n=1 Tax=Brevibacillus laterosporus TaxID=1465 RepID=UPI003D20A760